MRTSYRKIIGVAAISISSFGFGAGANAGWAPVIDAASYPHDQSPATIAAYLQDLVDVTAAPRLQS